MLKQMARTLFWKSVQIVLMFSGMMSFWIVYESIWGKLDPKSSWAFLLVCCCFAVGLVFAFSGTVLLGKLIDGIARAARSQRG